MKTVSYKLAKKLKELGFKGATTHYWIKPVGYKARVAKGKKFGFVEGDFAPYPEQRPKRYKAPTLDEMIDALPAGYKVKGMLQQPLFTMYKGLVGYFSGEYSGHYRNCENDNMADACAELWILLKENKLI